MQIFKKPFATDFTDCYGISTKPHGLWSSTVFLLVTQVLDFIVWFQSV
jgi:hypothetical protein